MNFFIIFIININRIVVFLIETILVSGISYFIDNNNLSANELLNDKYTIDKNLLNNYELKSIELCDKIICNSELTHRIFKKIYNTDKLHEDYIDTSSLIKNCHNSNNNNNIIEKTNDILICCSNLNRKQKNMDLILQLFNNVVFNNYNKIIIGSNYNQFIDIINCKCVGLITNNECIEYMKQSKIIIIPSLFDSNPSIITEALLYKCIPILSTNIGFYDIYPTELVCNTFNIDEWKKKIINVLKKYDNYNNLKLKARNNNILSLLNIF